MTDPGKINADDTRPREAMRRRRVFATTPFVEFKREEVEQSIADRFEQHVRKYPQHAAIKTAAESVSYAELNQMANRVAHALLARSDTAGQRIALLLDQGAPFVAAMLGVFKAGNVCVPLDPSFPEARAAYIVDDSQTGLVVTNNKNLSSAQRLIRGERQLLNVDELDAQAPAGNPCLALRPEAEAYLIYTSGSTGQPKGVIQIHRNLLRNVMAQTNGYHLCADDRICLLASCSTAQGMATLFGGLLNGATICPFSIRDAGVERLAPWLIAEKITVYISAATVFRHFIHVLTGDEQFPDLRLVRLGSEAVRRQDVDLYKKHFAPGCLFINALSSTETGNFSQYVIDQKTEVTTDLVPVGYPVEGVEIMLLDEAGAEVGPNCVGEIAIKGRYLSPGYWQRPDLTEKVFRPAPDGSGDRIYRTHDLGIRREDGCFEHVGRRDFRVKIRGLGVELEEVEALLFQHPAVQDAVAEVRPDGLGDNRLITYIVACGGQKPTAHELRRHLKNKLPEQMVPAAFVFLDRLPMTPNGKVDRTALAALEVAGAGEENCFVGPRDQVEADLTTIWQEILQIDQIGVHDSFYDVGGHSLTATRVVSRVRSIFQVDLPLREFLEHPTIAWLSEWLESTRRSGPQPAEISLQKVPRDRELPLSFAQQRLWFLNQFKPGDLAYNLPWALRLTGALNLPALEQTLTEIVRRHESLRTVFPSANDRPVQRILPPQPMQLALVDLRQLPDQEREGELRRRIDDEGLQPFDLEHGPLFRAVLLRLAETDQVLILTMHHIVSDRWSKWILAHELESLYEAFCAGRPSPLSELPIQYADFAQWQQERLRGAVLEDQLGYWKKKLGGDLPPLRLPTDRPRPAVLTSRGATISSRIPLPLANSLKIVGRREGVTLYMILLAAFQTLLLRYTGQEDIVVGSPIANRNRVEIENLIGFFVNTLVLRNDLSGDPTFCEFLRRVRGTALEAYAHQDLPFEKLVEELQPRRELSYTPLFQVMFALQNVPRQALRLSGLSVSPLAAETGTAKFDLALTVLEELDGLQASWEYNTDLFDCSTITRMSGHFQNLLEGIAANPEQRLSGLPVLTEAQKQQVLLEWNDTEKNYPADKCIHELFEAQVEQTPQAVAVIFEDKLLTYRELDRRANQLAQHLQGLGVGTEVLVGLCMERSVEMTVAVLGILKAGGAYVPLDCSHPKERLAFILEDAGISLLLTQRSLVGGLPKHSARMVCFDSEWEIIARESEVVPIITTEPENLAYVIYTSGSTGKPKGVQVPHRAVVNFLNSMRQRPGLSEQDILVAVTTLSFDIAGLELFLPLSVGARTVLVGSEIAADGSRLASILKTSGATVLQATPPTWRLLMETEWPTPHQFKVLCGGEALPRKLADHLLDRASCVWNMYGPTETTIWSATHRVESGGGAIPVGRPIDNTQIYILDLYLNPVPVGVYGELYIGGAGLGRGYLNRPNLTAEKFIPNPFSTEAGSRLYRTGDLARYLSDGAIQFLGRIDQQVKVRGFRIELGELEAVMSQHPGVAEAVAVVREDTPENKQLVAYVVGKVLSTPTVSELRSFLKEKLPDYMIPGVFVMLETLPLSANGKVDRRALPAPGAVRAETFAGPRTPIEKKLAEIFIEVLKAESVGIHDNFFDLGGHSLSATQVGSRVRNVFRVELPILCLFESPTIIELAAVIEEMMLD